ncbi:hypothetical protein PROFUN_07091 [Planoprotostelium fungivorum]|uniref:protein-tyrosine-phosphatase n=1 Tax=Planoprotostelium fungivorum TaxID=1890364 RepID=A0A2P6NN32_9EUKA|nr:hypothetical protein PROFUN_07091 [Planoprotostelium fungivorum]
MTSIGESGTTAEPPKGPKQSLLSLFFKLSGEGSNHKKEENERREKNMRDKGKKSKREERRKKKEEDKANRLMALAKKEEEYRMKTEGKHIVPGLYLGSRLAALNWEWVTQSNVGFILNVTAETKNYFEKKVASEESKEDAEQKMDEETEVVAEKEVPEGAEIAQLDVVQQTEETEPISTEEAIISQEEAIITEEEAIINEEEADIHYHRISVSDSLDTELIDHFSSAHEFIKTSIASGGNVLVHCREGLSRSPTIVISYLMKHHAMDLATAHAHVLDCNGNLRINQAFQRQLMEYDRQLYEKKSLDFFDKKGRRNVEKKEVEEEVAAPRSPRKKSEAKKSEGKKNEVKKKGGKKEAKKGAKRGRKAKVVSEEKVDVLQVDGGERKEEGEKKEEGEEEHDEEEMYFEEDGGQEKQTVESKKEETVESKKEEMVEPKKEEMVESKKEEMVEPKKEETPETTREEKEEEKKEEEEEKERREEDMTAVEETIDQEKEESTESGKKQRRSKKRRHEESEDKENIDGNSTPKKKQPQTPKKAKTIVPGYTARDISSFFKKA